CALPISTSTTPVSMQNRPDPDNRHSLHCGCRVAERANCPGHRRPDMLGRSLDENVVGIGVRMRISCLPACAVILFTMAPSASAWQVSSSKADIALGTDLGHMVVSVSQGELG